MSRLMAIMFIALMLLSCSFKFNTGSLQHYNGPRLAPSGEATLNYHSYLRNILIDGVWLAEMKPLDNPDGFKECVSRENLGWCEGSIKLAPGVHRVRMMQEGKATGGGGFHWLECEREFEGGMQYDLVVRREVIDSQANKKVWTIWCEIK